MSTNGLSGALHEMSYEEFAKHQIPRYHGPMVKIEIGVTVYHVSKIILCETSRYFARMFDGNFKEGEAQSAVLEKVEGVVSNRSFELLLQWLYLGRITVGEEPPSEQISAMIEFARFADMLGIDGVEPQTVEHMRATILANSPSPTMWA
ncbi:hypothetical protein FE257_000790 [Aspergillus nanangensis]|uniref:BTB domain-containing protein n=1 Tax=Aspergillus nanangensis TaxID=2582783 RepID=A0AAD4GPB6_ASPNN|nr:hypothetical protein FE257_000790 [Aspergillus nanangensis]